MKKFLIAAFASLLIFGGQAGAEAASADKLDAQNVETQELGKWAHFRDKYILGRETENERRDREEWERRHRRDYRDDYRHDRHRYGPPPRQGYGYPPPPRR